jgi:hypothetical protein
MPDDFTGNPAPLHDRDYERAAHTLGCTVAALRAVAQVESAGGGFLDDRRPKILFERHVFHARTAGVHSARHSNVSWPQRGGYLGGTREYDRLAQAIKLNRKAALESTSWGKFQLMGFNHKACGHSTVAKFVAAMVSGEPAQLAAFVAFIQSRKLADELVRRDWSAFAQGYNGPAFAENAYDRRMADAYAVFVRSGSGPEHPPLLALGDSGPDVVRVQTLLGLRPDGAFGPATRAAVAAFQTQRGLAADGVVGMGTWKALLA